MSESIPTSVTGFAHRRGRADSSASFTYLQPADDEQAAADAVQDNMDNAIEDEDLDTYDRESVDLEPGQLSLSRMSSTYSRSSVHDCLLRSDSGRSESFVAGKGKMSQKIYIINEDLTIAVAGFVTSPIGFTLYAVLCIATFGLAWLLLRWLPRWKVSLVGRQTPLRECTWVVIEVCADPC